MSSSSQPSEKNGTSARTHGHASRSARTADYQRSRATSKRSRCSGVRHHRRASASARAAGSASAPISISHWQAAWNAEPRRHAAGGLNGGHVCIRHLGTIRPASSPASSMGTRGRVLAPDSACSAAAMDSSCTNRAPDTGRCPFARPPPGDTRAQTHRAQGRQDREPRTCTGASARIAADKPARHPARWAQTPGRQQSPQRNELGRPAWSCRTSNDHYRAVACPRAPVGKIRRSTS